MVEAEDLGGRLAVGVTGAIGGEVGACGGAPDGQAHLHDGRVRAGREHRTLDEWRNLTAAAPAAGSQLVYTDAEVTFPLNTALGTENGVVAQRLVNRNLDSTIMYDVIVVGSGMGGGVPSSRSPRRRTRA